MSEARGLAAYLELTRPRLLASSLSDVLAGVALAGGLHQCAPSDLARGLAFSLLVYAGGMVANDVADVKEDARLGRPRPIPDGRVSHLGAALLMFALFGAALAIAPARLGAVPYLLLGLVIAYDFVAKRVTAIGALVLGACRAFNLSVGILLVEPSTRFTIGTSAWTTTWPWWQSCVLVYGAYTALAVVHGSLEDRSTTTERRSKLVLLLAAALPFTLIYGARRPFALAAACTPTLVAALRAPGSGKAWVAKRTGVLLRGLARVTFAIACGLGAWVEAGLLAIPAWLLPYLFGVLAKKKRWS